MALEPNAHTFVKADDGDALYDFLRRDRDEALLEVVELRQEKRLLEEQISSLGSSSAVEDHAACNAEIRQLRERNSQLEAELENQRSSSRSASWSRDQLTADLAAERGESQMYQEALDEARAALESTSAWGHEMNDSLQKANADLREQIVELRQQRSLRKKIVSRYRWEMKVRDRLSTEIDESGTATDR